MRRWFPLLILWVAFAARMALLGSVRHEFDWGVPHGIGLQIAEAWRAGTGSSLPPLNFGSSIVIPNPLLSSYVWALVSFITPSPVVATGLSAMFSVLAVAMTYDLARRIVNQPCALIAATLMAVSPWSIYFADGTWLQGQLEACAVVVAWLLWTGLARMQTRRIVAGFVAAALFAHTYLVALGLLAQAPLGAIGLLRRRPVGWLMGLVLLAISVFVLRLSLPRGVVSSPFSALAVSDLSQKFAGLQIPDTALHGWGHALRLVSGRDHEVNGIDHSSPLSAATWTVTNIRATATEVLLLIGIVVCALGISLPPLKSFGQIRIGVLLWWFVPIFLSVVLSTVRPDTLVHPFYMLLTAPAGYVLVGMALAWLHRVLKRPWLIGGLCCALAGVSLGRLAQFDLYERQHPLIGQLAWLPSREQQRLRATWQPMCAVLATDDDHRWTASVFESYKNTRLGAQLWQANADSVRVYLDADEGGRSCYAPYVPDAFAMADTLTTTLSTGDRHLTYVWDPQRLLQASPLLSPTLTTNIGWRLMRLDAPAVMNPGATYTITHIWRIDSLPNEPYADWYYAPFVKLVAPDGQARINIDSAKSVLGADWKVGAIIVSQLHFVVPADSQAGLYRLEISLFDPNQKKNAAYFADNNPSEPIVTLSRPVQVQ